MRRMAPVINDVYPAKAQFRSGEPVEIVVEAANPGPAEEGLVLEARVMHLGRLEETLIHPLTLEAGARVQISLGLSPRETTYGGYGLDAGLFRRGTLLASCSSSFDVAVDYRQALRYGFLSDFHPAERGRDADILALTKLHLNIIQFYDWMYRHDDLVPGTDEFVDPLGRLSSLEVIREKIDRCHERGIRAIAYGAIYAASPEFFRQHQDWALYDSAGRPYNLGNLFYIMNLDPACPWRDHIIGQYKRALAEVGFDGIHLDTYGFPKKALAGPPGRRGLVRLDEQFPAFIRYARAELTKLREDVCLIFNAVGSWPLKAVAGAEQDAVYIEVWPPYERYHHLAELIRWGRHLGGGKPVILAAYLAPFAAEGPVVKEPAETAALILTAVIVAHGGSHLLLGEEYGILTQGYYVKHARADGGFIRTLRNYYDFVVRYAELFYDGELEDVSMTHAAGDNLEYRCEQTPWTTYGEPGKVWTVIREKPGWKTVSLINLMGQGDDYWNKGKETPLPRVGIRLRLQVEGGVKSVLLASPDREMGRPQELHFSLEESPRGLVLVAEVPRLQIWSLVIVEME